MFDSHIWVLLPFPQLIDFHSSLTRGFLLSFNREVLTASVIVSCMAQQIACVPSLLITGLIDLQFLSLETFIVLLQTHLPVLYKVKIFVCFRLKRILIVVSFLWTLTTYSNTFFLFSVLDCLKKTNLRRLKCTDFLEFYQKCIYYNFMFYFNKFLSNIYVKPSNICCFPFLYTWSFFGLVVFFSGGAAHYKKEAIDYYYNLLFSHLR